MTICDVQLDSFRELNFLGLGQINYNLSPNKYVSTKDEVQHQHTISQFIQYEVVDKLEKNSLQLVSGT